MTLFGTTPVTERFDRVKELEIDDEALREIFGGIVTEKDLNRDVSDYFDAGIQLQQTDWNTPEYYFRGKRISVKCADEIADFYFENGRQPSFAEIKPY